MSGKNHGESGTRLHRIWKGAKCRCNNKNRKDYKYYGGKGVTFSEDWDCYTGFANWARANGYEEHLELDRIDSGVGYCPSNCRWVEQGVNKASAHSKMYKFIDPNGEVHDVYNLKEFCVGRDLCRHCLASVHRSTGNRQHKGWRKYAK